jgi:hypothetical protein
MNLTMSKRKSLKYTKNFFMGGGIMSLLGVTTTDFVNQINSVFSTVGPIILAILGIVVAIVVVRFVFNFIRSRLSR